MWPDKSLSFFATVILDELQCCPNLTDRLPPMGKQNDAPPLRRRTIFFWRVGTTLLFCPSKMLLLERHFQTMWRGGGLYVVLLSWRRFSMDRSGCCATHLGYCAAHIKYCATHLGYCATHLGYCSTHLGYCATHLGHCAIQGGAVTFACKSSWQDWQDWYI